MKEFPSKNIAPQESAPLPERSGEALNIAPAEAPPRFESIDETVPATAVPVGQTNIPQVAADPVTASLEAILSEDLYEHFYEMSPPARLKFEQKGVETVSKLRVMVASAKIKAKDVLKLIIDWLAFIPGVNKYFLEQASKIKTDKILELHRRNHPE
jgi:hypothetical protein